MQNIQKGRNCKRQAKDCPPAPGSDKVFGRLCYGTMIQEKKKYPCLFALCALLHFIKPNAAAASDSFMGNLAPFDIWMSAHNRQKSI